MVRLHLDVTEEQARAVEHIARQRGTTVSDVVRAMVSLCLGPAPNVPGDREERLKRIRAVAGKYRSGCADLARNHDEYLAQP